MALAAATLAGCAPGSRAASTSGDELTSVATLDHTIAAGGRPARFRATVHNGTHSQQHTALLIETPIVGKEPSDLQLDRKQGSSWIPVKVGWDDPDEPEFFRSGQVAVDVRPGTSQSYDFRIGIPGTYKPCRYDDCGVDLDKRTLRFSVTLVNLGGRGVRPEPTSRTARFRLGSQESPRLTVTPPESVTFAGGPAEFTVGVDNSSGHAHERTRLVLTLKGTMDGL
ncbi:MAG TPA: hypothetical protein VE287_00335, partial [Actinopolymorphaceae bacterium]|nr:hypothetical protein [Actinopolymorphaceae bacterium]